MHIDRRNLLKAAAAASLLGAAPRALWAAGQAGEKADYTLRIGTGLVELAPEHIVSTTLYNGQFPGPMLRFKEGQPVTIDIHNDTDRPELVHPHGLIIPIDADGAAEEGSPFVPAHGMRRVSFVPKPSGFRFYHTHVVPANNLSQGTYTGQAGPIYIEPKDNPGAYDRKIFLVLKEFEPTFSQGGDMPMDVLAGAPIAELQEIGKKADEKFKGPKGYEVGYDLFSINGKMLGQGEPIRVKQGERVLLRQRGRNPQPRAARPQFQDCCARRQPRAHASRSAAALARHGRTCLGAGRDEPSRRVGDGRPRR
ncbi:MAG: multicopper oxidase domain-containing protein [Rhodomicrobium sp.]